MARLKKTKLIVLFLSAVFYACSSSVSDTEDGGQEPGPVQTKLWEFVQYEDIPIVTSYSTETNLYSFTGFEVFKSGLDGSNPVQLTELNDRSVFFVDESNNTLFSINDSTILRSSNEAASFDTLTIPSFRFRSTLLSGNKLYSSSENGLIISINLTSEEKDTLYQSASLQDIQFISLLDNALYLNADNSTKLLMLNESKKGLQAPGFESSATSSVLKLGNTNILLAATRFQKILRSTDSGETWNQTWPEGLPANPTTDLVFTSQNRVYTSILGSGIYYSDDTGETWESVTDTSLNVMVYSITQTTGNELLANTKTGIYKALFDPKTN